MWNNNTIEDEIQRNSLEYGIAVNTDRSLPDAKSGLKPVAKRIIWDAFIEGRTANKPHVKSARIVGDTMGRFHPHGDSSIYGAMVRLSQDWVMRYPLFDGHGNFGNILGDGPAAMRYTEARLTKLSEAGLLNGIKKESVDFIPNYDETEKEPVTLPAIFPNLLCNPNEGIGWAMGCSWAPHNLKEVANAIRDYLDGKEPMLPGPDFPTGGIIINKNDIPTIMKTGHGSVKIRGRYKIDKQKIIFYEIPYGTRVESLITEIGNAADEGKINGITAISNDTDSKGVKLVIKVEKNTLPEKVVAQLFNKTSLQSSFSYNQVALIGKTPTEMNLKDAIEVYVEHNISCLKKEAQYDLIKAKERLHIVDGLIKALEDIDNIINLIKKSDSASNAKQRLIEIYNFSEIQAKAILDMKLSKLARLEKVELEKEKEELLRAIEDLEHLLKFREVQVEKLWERLSDIVKKFGDERRTELAQIEVPKEEKEIAEVIPENVVVVTTKTGLIKRVPQSSFRVQRRNTKGVKSEDNALLDVVKTNTVDTMMFFTNCGKMYRTLVDNIPVGTNATKGCLISDLVKLDNDEKIIAVTSLHRKTTPKFAIFVTKKGMIKKTYLEEYMSARKNTGIAALRVRDDDEVVDVIFQDEESIILISKNGNSIKFETKDITPVGRVTLGVKGMRLDENDEIVAALPIHKDTDNLAIFTTNGLGKKVELNEFPLQGRGGRGTICSKEEIAGALMISDEDNILLCGNKNSLCIAATEIPLLGKISLGNIMIKDNKILKVTKI
jgi:DNA gyrase subunit A